jgi:hypothetical protein
MRTGCHQRIGSEFAYLLGRCTQWLVGNLFHVR